MLIGPDILAAQSKSECKEILKLALESALSDLEVRLLEISDTPQKNY